MKIKNIVKYLALPLGILSVAGIVYLLNIPDAQGVSVENPLKVTTVDEVATSVRSYLVRIVGGIAIFFIVLSGILYIVGGASGNDDWINWGKKGFFGAIAGVVIVVGAGMILNEIYYIIGGRSYDVSNLSAKEIVQRLISFLLAIVGFIFLISMIIGGIWYFASGGDESKAELGKKTMKYSLIGITVALSALIIIKQITSIIGGQQGGGGGGAPSTQGSPGTGGTSGTGDQPITPPIIDDFSQMR